MAKSFSSARCVHCLKYFDELTSDHVFPKSWYPRSTPANLEKWQAPSCMECNQEHGKNESELLIRLGLCVSREELASLGISEKALRAIDPSVARDPIDRQRRILKRRQIIAEMRLASQIPNQTFVLNFRPSVRDLENNRHALPLPMVRFKLLGRKLACGATYVLHNHSYIEKDHVIAVHMVNDSGARYAKAFIDKYGARVHRGPGLVVGQARPAEDTQSALFEILIWNRFILHVSVVDALAAAADEQNQSLASGVPVRGSRAEDWP
jgi:hypothetical protein